MLPITSENWAAILGLYHTSISSLEGNIPLQIESEWKPYEKCWSLQVNTLGSDLCQQGGS